MNYGRVASAREIPSGDVIGFDIESSPKKKYIRQGWSPPPDPRLVDVAMAQVAVGSNVYLLLDNFESLKPLLEDKRVKKVIHNAAFEYKHMLYHYGIEIKNFADTMLLEGIYEAGRKPDLSLDAVAFKHVGVHLAKKTRNRFIDGEPVDESMMHYGAKDAWVMLRLYDAMTSQPMYDGMEQVVKLETSLVPAFADIELRGFMLDRKKWQPLAEQIELEYRGARDELLKALPTKLKQMTMFGDVQSTVKLNSREGMLKIFSDVGVDLSDLRQSTIATYVEKHPHPLLTLYARYTKLQKAQSTYGFNFLSHINPVTGRVHQSVMQLNARTGRLSGRDPNLMNIPKDSKYRSCFRAGHGNLLAWGDYSQQEIGVLAEWSGDKNLILGFESGLDVYVYVARLVFRDKTVDKSDPRRAVVKGITLGLMYGMGVRLLATSLKISESEARTYWDAVAENFPDAFAWGEGSIEFAKEHGYVKTLLGRIRYLDTSAFDYGTQARNTPIQGSAADMLKLAILLLWKKISLVNEVHDELVAECRKDDVVEVAKILKRGMMDAAARLVKKVEIKVDTRTGMYWHKG